jgi:hypothetical protein
VRRLRRWIRAQRAEWRLRARRAAIRAEISGVLGRPVRLQERGNLGHDSNYDVLDDGRPIAVLRLVNPHKKRPTPPAGMPFEVLDGPARIAHEWDILSRGAESGITPRPLWRGEDALLCEHLPFQTLTSSAQRRPDKVWEYLLQASAALHRLHGTVGVAHMDASLSNVIADDDHRRMALVDFEYTPAPGVSLAEQKLYDHLRLLQATGKFIRPAQRGGHGPWFEQLAGFLDEDMRAAPMDRIGPGLRAVLKDEIYGPAIRALLPQAV